MYHVYAVYRTKMGFEGADFIFIWSCSDLLTVRLVLKDDWIDGLQIWTAVENRTLG